MCYREADLNLEGVHLACLSGDNGAGKSALLDAITWAIWGKGRGSDDEMVAQNEVEMAVDLEFNMGEHTYKSSRRRSKRGVGKTDLVLSIFNGSGWTNISEDSQRSTQQKIIQVVGMRYETFINSAFLLQGRADEFTSKKPAERKEILAEILGLDYYDELEKKAKLEASNAENTKRDLSRQVEDLENTVRQRPTYAAEQAEAVAELSAHSQKLADHEPVRAKLETTIAQLEVKQKQLDEMAVSLRNLQAKLERLTQQSRDTEREIARCQVVIERKAEIEQGYADLERAKNGDNELCAKAAQHTDLSQQQTKLQRTVDREQNGLQAERRGLQAQQKAQEELAYNVRSFMRELENAQRDLEKSNGADTSVKGYQEQVQTLREEFAALNTQSKGLDAEIKKLTTKIAELPSVGSPCERCGTRLTPEARAQTLQQYSHEETELQQQQAALETTKTQLTAQGNQLKAHIKTLEPLAKNLLTLKGRVGSLEEKLKNAQQAESRVAELQTKIDEIATTLENKQYAVAEQQRLAQVEHEIVALAYDYNVHREVTKRRAELSYYEPEKSRLDTALELLPTYQRTLQDYAESQLGYQDEQQAATARQQELRAELGGLAELRKDLARVTYEMSSVRNLEREANNRLSRAKTRLEACDDAAEQLVVVEEQLDQAALEKSLFDDLAAAFGKKGIQALVIDSVLPELEDEANQMLSEMSGGRLSIRFDTQRDTKKGDSTIETLDLKISDEQGMRPYEMFSGGEAFRVNFAVRIALSKLLARRNGAQLRTLFIDEGFGTQDGAGRERLIEAIHNIENQFERILVITHIPELKDAFPVRIEIEKTPFGSRLSLN